MGRSRASIGLDRYGFRDRNWQILDLAHVESGGRSLDCAHQQFQRSKEEPMHDHHEETQKSSKTLLKTMAVVFIVALAIAALIR